MPNLFFKEFFSESGNGQHKLNMMLSKGELLCTLLTKEKASGIQAKIATAKEDWKNFHSNLHQKESALEVYCSQPCGHVLCYLLLLLLLKSSVLYPVHLDILVRDFGHPSLNMTG